MKLNHARRSCDRRGAGRLKSPTMALMLVVVLATAGCTDDAALEAESTEVLSRSIGQPTESKADDVGQPGSADEHGAGVPPDEVPPDAERGEVVRSEDDIELTEPEPELVEESVTLDDAIDQLGIETPCDLYTTAELRTQMTQWSQAAGLIADLPNGLLPTSTEIGFEPQAQTPTECSWFSEPQLWSVQIAFQPAGGFTDELQARGEPVPNIGDSASLNDDTSGSVQIGDLYITVTNLPPGHTQTNNDRTVLLNLLTDIATRLA